VRRIALDRVHHAIGDLLAQHVGVVTLHARRCELLVQVFDLLSGCK
jgi:hypothetical protein